MLRRLTLLVAVLAIPFIASASDADWRASFEDNPTAIAALGDFDAVLGELEAKLAELTAKDAINEDAAQEVIQLLSSLEQEYMAQWFGPEGRYVFTSSTTSGLNAGNSSYDHNHSQATSSSAPQVSSQNITLSVTTDGQVAKLTPPGPPIPLDEQATLQHPPLVMKVPADGDGATYTIVVTEDGSVTLNGEELDPADFTEGVFEIKDGSDTQVFIYKNTDDPFKTDQLFSNRAATELGERSENGAYRIFKMDPNRQFSTGEFAPPHLRPSPKLEALIEELTASGDLTEEGAEQLRQVLQDELTFGPLAFGYGIGGEFPHHEFHNWHGGGQAGVPHSSYWFKGDGDGFHGWTGKKGEFPKFLKLDLDLNGRTLEFDIDDEGHATVTGEGFSDEELDEIREALEAQHADGVRTWYFGNKEMSGIAAPSWPAAPTQPMGRTFKPYGGTSDRWATPWLWFPENGEIRMMHPPYADDQEGWMFYGYGHSNNPELNYRSFEFRHAPSGDIKTDLDSHSITLEIKIDDDGNITVDGEGISAEELDDIRSQVETLGIENLDFRNWHPGLPPPVERLHELHDQGMISLPSEQGFSPYFFHQEGLEGMDGFEIPQQQMKEYFDSMDLEHNLFMLQEDRESYEDSIKRLEATIKQLEDMLSKLEQQLAERETELAEEGI